MSLGIVKPGELMQLNLANPCNGYIGEVFAGLPSPSMTVFYPLPDIYPYYALAFLAPLPACHWSSVHKMLPSRGTPYHAPLCPPGSKLYYYWVDAKTLFRVSSPSTHTQPTQTEATDPQSNPAAFTENKELEEIFVRDRIEEQRQLEAAKVTRDNILRYIFGGD